MTRSGWYPDPTGRFPRRWHDGEDWTASVIDQDGQQGYDALPTATAPAVPALPGSASPVPPPPPQQVSPTPPPPPGQPAPAAQPSWQAESSWQPGQAWQSGPSSPAAPPAQPYQQPYQQPARSAGQAAWQPGLSPAPAFAPTSAATRLGQNPLVFLFTGIAVGLFGFSLFLLDWAEGVAFSDFETGGQSVAGIDNLVLWNLDWLAYVWVAVAVAAFGLFVIAKVAPHRFGHVVAALVAAIGAVMSAFVVVKLFRGPGDPEYGAWLLPAAYLVLLAAVVVSAQREPD